MIAGLAQGPLTARLAAFAQTRLRFIEGAALALAVLILLVSVLPNLANHPAITDDEMWVFSSAYKLAREGVFGSDMFSGFYNAEGHYYFNMPAQHFVIAAAFKLLGAGIVQARLAGVVYAIATLLLTYLLTRRLYGVAAAVLSLGLLLFLRLNIGFDTGLPLQELAANMRYDLAPVPFLLAGCLFLLGGPSLGRAIAAGAIFGIAVLFQFYGAFIFPMAVAFLWLEALPTRERLRLIGALLGAAALVGVPYGAYILSDLADYKGQVRTIDDRAELTDPRFYFDNLLDEPNRFLRPLAFKEIPRGAGIDAEPRFLSLTETLTRRPSAKLGVLVGLPLALAYSYRRARESRGERLLCLCLAGLAAQFALLDSTKFFIYWIPVIPFLCIGIAGAAVWLLQPPQRDRPRLVAAAATLIVLLLFLAEGSVARLNGIRTAPHASGYDRLAAVIQEQIPPGSRVVGATSLWWGLRETEYRSYFLFFYLTRPDAGPFKTTISEFLDGFDADYIVLTRYASGELDRALPPGDYADWRGYLSRKARKIARLEAPVATTYGYVDIWKLD